MAYIESKTSSQKSIQQKNTYIGGMQSNTTFTIGFKPKKMLVVWVYTTSIQFAMYYNADSSTTSYERFTKSTVDTQNVGASINGGISAITNSGFTLRANTNTDVRYLYFFAIG